MDSSMVSETCPDTLSRPSSSAASEDAQSTPPGQPESTRKTSQIYAFLNHSTATVSDNLPPKVDDKSLARQRRRRTSPEDQAILEAAFFHNSKPDKAARLEIVKQVALGEKEVQIWFQNRRQSTRRKSRPLLPHEIAQYQSSKTEAFPFFPSGEAAKANLPPDAFHISESFVLNEQTSVSVIYPIDSDEQNPQPVGYIANRRSAPTRRELQRAELNQDKPAALEPSESESRKRKSGSFMRLSMDSAGKATVVTMDTSSPSPPRPYQTPSIISGAPTSQPTLQPASSSETREAPLPLALPPLKRSASGRSRDSRSWEFWCDKDSRTELEGKAEKDGNGSAANAIDLLRSSSGRRVLGQIPSKRNSFLSRQSTAVKRTKLDLTVPSLTKAKTSDGRLQRREAQQKKPHIHLGSINLPGNDSDKENWSPDTEISQESLGDHLSAASTKHRAIVNDDENEDPEVAAFMKGGRRSSNVSGEEEMDCVQGLLSLSQGAWR